MSDTHIPFDAYKMHLCPFKPGDSLTAHDTSGPVMLTRGKVYTAIECYDAVYDGGFRYHPAVSVIDDEGSVIKVHTTRFHIT
jgi:hypothetical protein